MPKFDVYYEKLLSTWNQDTRSKGKVRLVLEKRPTKPDEKRKIEQRLERDFLDQFRRQRRNIADIRYRITRVVAVKNKVKEKLCSQCGINPVHYNLNICYDCEYYN